MKTPALKIVTWNVNSIRARLPNICEWLNEHRPDVVLLQEIKAQEENFPHEDIENLGYNVAIHGQKSYNGVAILSRFPLEDVVRGLPTFAEDPQARYIEAVTAKMRVASVYIPNGQSVGCEKFHYKLQFLTRLRDHLSTLLSFDEQIIIGGDYNIAPHDNDVHDPKAWHEEILCSTIERQHLNAIFNLGYADAIRLKHKGPGPFSWWDYRSGSWARNDGLRIDHLLLSPLAADHLEDAGVDPAPRGKDKASDHAPVWCAVTGA